nr:hypothetical protein [Mucilaginibacter sp. OK268]
MVAKHYGRNFKIQTLRKLCEIRKVFPSWVSAMLRRTLDFAQ